MRATAELHYMVWAKRQASRPIRYTLAASGMPPPDEPLLLDAPLDLRQRGADVPPDARARVAERFGLAPEQAILTLGTSQALFLLCASHLRPGDVVLVEDPTYEPLHAVPGLLGARVERFPRRAGDGYALPHDLPETIARLCPALLLLSSPHNPTGALVTHAGLEPVVQAMQAVGGVVFVDEVYLEYLADAPARSAVHVPGPVATASSLTKAYGLGTARFGWLLGEPALVERAARYNDFVSVVYPNPCAQLAMAAWDRLPALQARAEQLRLRNLPLVQAWVDGRADVTWVPPAAAVTGLMRLARVEDDLAFCERLVDERETLVVPGSFFGAAEHVRVGFGVPEPVLREGLDRLGAALDAVGNDRAAGSVR